jgi:hypothetical protein
MTYLVTPLHSLVEDFEMTNMYFQMKSVTFRLLYLIPISKDLEKQLCHFCFDNIVEDETHFVGMSHLQLLKK